MTSPRRPPALLVDRELEFDVIGAAFLASSRLNTSDDLSARRAVAVVRDLLHERRSHLPAERMSSVALKSAQARRRRSR